MPASSSSPSTHQYNTDGLLASGVMTEWFRIDLTDGRKLPRGETLGPSTPSYRQGGGRTRDGTQHSEGWKSAQSTFAVHLIPAVLEGSRRQRFHVLNLQDSPDQRFGYSLTLGDLCQGPTQVLPLPLYGVHPRPEDAPAPPNELALRPGLLRPCFVRRLILARSIAASPVAGYRSAPGFDKDAALAVPALPPGMSSLNGVTRFA